MPSRPTAATEPPWGWGRKFSRDELVIYWLQRQRADLLAEMARLGVPATMPETLGTPPPPDADGHASSDFPRLGKRP